MDRGIYCFVNHVTVNEEMQGIENCPMKVPQQEHVDHLRVHVRSIWFIRMSSYSISALKQLAKHVPTTSFLSRTCHEIAARLHEGRELDT